MCVIIHFKPGQKIDPEKLKNACYNNWHSYGLVTKIDGKLDIRRVVPKSGEVDPKEVQEALDKDEEFERILHLRHNTAGATTLKNCHPFDVYFDDHRQVVFMHNGTFGEYKPKKFVDDKLVDDPDGPVDSLTFAEENITPILVRSGGNIDDEYLRRVIRRFWSGNNRGILISSDQDVWRIGDDWKKIKDTEGGELHVSNDDYFDKVSRGPERDRRVVAAAKLREEQEALQKKHKKDSKDKVSVAGNGPFFTSNRSMSVLTNQSGVSTFQPTKYEVSSLKEFNLAQPSLSQLSESPVNICNDWDVYDREHLVSLGGMSRDEWEEMYKDKTTCTFVMDYLSSDYRELYKEYLELEEKCKKQEKHIEELAKAAKKVG